MFAPRRDTSMPWLTKRRHIWPRKNAESGVYRVTDIIGTSKVSWERSGGERRRDAARSLRDLRVAEVSKLDMKIGRWQSHCLSCSGFLVIPSTKLDRLPTRVARREL